MHDSNRSGHGMDDANQGWALLSSAIAADALDVLGMREQCLAYDVRPLEPTQRVVGRAFPVHSQPATSTAPTTPYEGLMAALDDLTADSVFVFETGRSDAAGVWGELITTACVATGIAGALTDGLIRDVSIVLESGFPVFSRGATPYDSKGRVDVVSHGAPIVIDGVTISAGDLVVGDADGVCIVPAEVELEVLELVRQKREGEGSFRDAVRGGTSISDAFRRFGVP